MKRAAILLALVALLPLASVALAGVDSSYDVRWWTVDGGGYTLSTGGSYSLGSTIGQPDASVWQGDDYTLTGGFWGGALVEHHIYLPVVLRDF